jgi:DNA-binding NarL/FixJ family response regulator
MSTPEGTRHGGGRLKVVVADDDAFTTSLVSEGLRAHGFAVATALTTADAWELVAREEPHALVSDLNFGPGESAAALLTRVHQELPWVGLVVLTSHQSPELAIQDAESLPAGVVYLVKTQLTSTDDLREAVLQSISGAPAAAPAVAPLAASRESIVLTSAQAEVLRMLADGASTRAIAELRGTSVRAAETMLSRLYLALEVDTDEHSNPRVSAVRLWQQGRVTVQGPGRGED